MRILSFLRLGAIIGSLPNNIMDGDPVDAVPVMNDFNWIVSQVNANVPPLVTAGTGAVIFVPSGSVGGTANAITLSPTPVIAAYVAGQSYRFIAKAVNTGAVTINTSGLGNRALTYTNGNGFAGGELQVGGTYDITDNGTNYMVTNVPVGTGLLSYAPTLAFGGASTGMTYATRTANVMTLGNWVWVWIYIVLSAKGSSTGYATVSLPITVNPLVSGLGVIPMGSIQFSNVTFTGSPGIAPYPNTALANILVTSSGAAQVGLRDTNFANNSMVACQVLYPGVA
ncbi:MAG: hypothetical protein ACRDTV_06010 [Mycobacterium sp.]